MRPLSKSLLNIINVGKIQQSCILILKLFLYFVNCVKLLKQKELIHLITAKVQA